MIFSFLSSGWVLNLMLPATAFIYKPADKSAVAALSVTGLGGGLGYMLSDRLAIEGSYDFNYSLAIKNIFLHGFDLGVKAYVEGGYAASRKSETLSATVAPNNSVFVELKAGQRFFDLGTAESKSKGKILVPDATSYASSGTMFGIGLSVGYERVVYVENLRVGAALSVLKSLTVSTALSVTEIQGSLLLSYQL